MKDETIAPIQWMTQEEIAVMRKLAEVWNDYSKLPVVHPNDAQEFSFGLHICQNILAARPYVRFHREP